MENTKIKIAGTSFTNATKLIKDVLTKDNIAFEDGLAIGIDYRLVPEPTNQFDPNAIAVEMSVPDRLPWTRIGYVPKNTPQAQLKEKLALPGFVGLIKPFKSLDNWSFYFYV